MSELKKQPAPTWDGPATKPNASHALEIKVPILSFMLPGGQIVYGSASLAYNPRQWSITDASFLRLVQQAYNKEIEPEQLADDLMRAVNEQIEPWAAQLQLQINVAGQQMTVTARAQHEDIEHGPRIQTAG